MTARILVAEDDPAISDVVADALRGAGYEAEHVPEGALALEEARSGRYDLMVLELLLAGVSGVEICRTLRSERSDLPIVMVTPLEAETARITVLEGGADQYVTKPFSTPELVARVRALLRRRELDRVGAVHVGSLHLDRSRHAATVDGKPILLTRSEFRLVSLLASEPGRPFTREELIQTLGEGAFTGDKRAIDVHISNLRRKLEQNPHEPRRIVTVRGVGYRLAAG